MRTKYKNVRRRLYPRYSTFEVNPPSDNFEVQYNNACKKIYSDDAPPVKNALHHLSAKKRLIDGTKYTAGHTSGNSPNKGRSKSVE